LNTSTTFSRDWGFFSGDLDCVKKIQVLGAIERWAKGTVRHGKTIGQWGKTTGKYGKIIGNP
jgi:hypothetical protein